MAIGVDQIRVMKQESTATGGDDADIGIHGAPRPIDVQEDALSSAGVFIQDEANNDEAVSVHREGVDLQAKDERVPVDHALYQFGHNWRTIPAGETRTIKAGWDHVCSEIEIKDTGILVIEDGAKLVLI